MIIFKETSSKAPHIWSTTPRAIPRGTLGRRPGRAGSWSGPLRLRSTRPTKTKTPSMAKTRTNPFFSPLRSHQFLSPQGIRAVRCGRGDRLRNPNRGLNRKKLGPVRPAQPWPAQLQKRWSSRIWLLSLRRFGLRANYRKDPTGEPLFNLAHQQWVSLSPIKYRLYATPPIDQWIQWLIIAFRFFFFPLKYKVEFKLIIVNINYQVLSQLCCIYMAGNIHRIQVN